jgi:hypothetical protein
MFGLGPLGSRESTCVLGMYIEVIEQDITSCKHPPHECSYQSLIKSLASQGLKEIQLRANYSKFNGHSCTSPAGVIQAQFLDSSFSCQTIYLQTSSEFPILCLPLSVPIEETGSFCPICY